MREEGGEKGGEREREKTSPLPPKPFNPSHQPPLSSLSPSPPTTTAQFTYGKFINSLLSFLIICFIVYFCVVNPMIKLMGYLDPKSAKRSCPECLSEVAAGARKCMFCCSAIPIGAAFQEQMAEDVELKKDLADVRANKV